MTLATQESTAEQLKRIDMIAAKIAERAAALNGAPNTSLSDLFVNSSQLVIILERLEKEASQNGWISEAELAKKLGAQVDIGKKQIQSYAVESGLALPTIYGDILKELESDLCQFRVKYRV